MGEFLFASYNLPFGVALVLMFSICALEGIGVVFGMGISSIVNGLFPDFDLDLGLDSGGLGDGVHTGGLTKLLGWLRFGQVPALMLFMVMLTVFGVAGYVLQAAAIKVFATALPVSIASAAAFVTALPLTRLLAGILEVALPRDETSAVSQQTFIGRVATVTSGTAKKDRAVQARLRDEYGQSHYILVEPDEEAREFPKGSAVLVVKQEGAVFKVIANPNEALIDC